jgi:hypothetical protein
MKKIANIVSTHKVDVSEYFNVVESMDQIIHGLPTLIVDYYYVDKNYPNFDIGDSRLEDNLYWTFKKTHKRDKYNEDLDCFVRFVYYNLIKDINYLFVDPIQYPYKSLRKENRRQRKIIIIPNLITEETISIIRKLFAADGTPLKIVYNQSFKPTADDKNPVGVPHYHFTNRTGEQMIYYKQYTETPDYIDKPKVFMTMKAGYERGRLFAFYKETPMGTTNNSMYMLVGSSEEGTKISTFLNSDIVSFLMKVTQYSEPPNYINEYKILNQLNVPESMDLSAGELDIIKKIVNPKEEGVVATPRKRGKSRNTTRRSSKTDS